jgi:hypothetical protein
MQMKPRKFKRTVYLGKIVVGEVEQTGNFDKDVEAVREFLKQKGLHKETTKVQAIFRQAVSFANTAAYIHKRDLLTIPANGLSAVPFVVNSAFSLELYFKALLALHGSLTRGHSLLKLYDALPSTAHDSLLEAAKQQQDKYKVKLSTLQDFRGFVSGVDTAFVDWRYCFETGNAPVFHVWETILIMAAAHEVCRTNIPKP